MTSTFAPLSGPSPFRKMAAAMWRRPNDPSVYGWLDVDVTLALDYLADQNRSGPSRLTLTHLVARAVAFALVRHPEANVKVRFWGKLEQRRTVDVFLQVASEDGRDLSGALVREADRKSLRELAEEIDRAVGAIRGGGDPTYAKSRQLFRRLPWWVLRPLLWVSDLLVNELHLDLPRQGMPVDPFGSAMVTSVGRFGIDGGFAPFTPVARCALILLVPSVRRRAWVVEDRLEIRPILRLCATFDHRILDGAHAGRLAEAVRGYLADPAAAEAAIAA